MQRFLNAASFRSLEIAATFSERADSASVAMGLQKNILKFKYE